MEKTRQPIPADLADMPPGPGLAAVLAGVDLSRLSGLDCVTVMRAQHRQAAHEQARLLAAIAEVARCDIGPDDALPRMDAPDEFAADEIRAALVWTRSAATAQLSLAWDLCSRLPHVFAALDRGGIDIPKAKIFSEWTGDLTDEQAHQICAALLPAASALTTGQLIDRIKRMAIAVDPDWARRRYEQAVRDRKVIAYRNDDGTATLTGCQLPADRTAAAGSNLDALAHKIKRSGDARPINHIRADIYLALLDGTYTGWREQDIIAHALVAAPADTARSDVVSVVRVASQVATDARSGNTRPTDASQLGAADDEASGEDSAPTAAPISTQQPSSAAPYSDRRPARRAGVEVRAEITTLLGWDDHPGEIAGSGPIHADLARQLVREQTAAEWRYAVTDEDGHLLYEGITRHRPRGYPSRAEAPTRGGIVELHIPLSVLRHLAAAPGADRRTEWAGVIADLARQAERQATATERRDGRRDTAEGDGRTPGRRLRRHTEIRDRTCTHPRCRRPAHGTDGDHTEEWARGGATWHGNIGSACRHDHRLRHEGGWTVRQPRPGYFVWISRLGIHYPAPPPQIIQPLPGPLPRERASLPHHDDPGDQGEVPIWHGAPEPPRPPTEAGPSPPPDPAEPIPF